MKQGGRAHDDVVLARLELRADDLVAVYPLRTVRIPYTSITDVHGDAPNHITWSTRLVVETDARSYWLPQAGADLALARDVILERVGRAASSSGST